jgi:superfamily II DNA or RNA helicase
VTSSGTREGDLTAEALASELKEADERLARLNAEAAKVRAHVNELRRAAATASERSQRTLPLVQVEPPRAHATSAEKVELFRSLFRGRRDVFAKYWENVKAGKKGYAPACANEWVRGVCEKPRVKCGECPSQAFLAVDERRIREHLEGRTIMGAYAMLSDETCWFLAADFDGDAWREDILAFAETCDVSNLPVALERSRSGDGGHAWFFFTEPVAASVVRRMACSLLTETMARRHQLKMDSYDRLFPNQDTMPNGGFGNLIALPLQKKARERGNTVFLDRALTPVADQWAYLASVARIPTRRVEEIADEAVRRGRVIGLRTGPTGDDDSTPWTRPPSGRPKKERVTGPLPGEVQAVLAQKLFVTKAGLPSPILNELKRLAAFQNPEFYKKQSMRLSTAMTPRVITCAEDHAEHVALPRGCLDEATDLFREHGSTVCVHDERVVGSPVDLSFRGNLTAVQRSAVDAMLAHDTGIFVAPPGSGKTVVGAYLAAARNTSTLVLVHRKPLVDQWSLQLAMFLGIDPSSVGRIGGGKDKPNGHLDVAMLQSLVRKGSVKDVVARYGHVIVDECHHLPAFSFERVLAEVKAKFVTGLTATPYRRDGHQPILHMQCGPVRFAIDAGTAGTVRPFEHKLVCRTTAFVGAAEATVQEHYTALVADEERNRMILDDVEQALVDGRSPLVLTERKDHLEYLATKLEPRARHLVVLHGGRGTKEERLAFKHLNSIPDDEERLVLATGRYIGEGFDDARLDALFLTMPVSWKGTMIQYAGRLHRLYQSKFEVCIYDYVDRNVPMLVRMFEKRLRAYRAMGYEIDAELAVGLKDDEADEDE